jgi:cytochrome oxidase Cu insertion factor (SCO1/SenC/PrrC family)
VERSEFGATGEDGEYEVGHASAMFVFGPDGTARIVYPFGTRQSDWTRDLPRLLDGEVPT